MKKLKDIRKISLYKTSQRLINDGVISITVTMTLLNYDYKVHTADNLLEEFRHVFGYMIGILTNYPDTKLKVRVKVLSDDSFRNKIYPVFDRTFTDQQLINYKENSIPVFDNQVQEYTERFKNESPFEE